MPREFTTALPRDLMAVLESLDAMEAAPMDGLQVLLESGHVRQRGIRWEITPAGRKRLEVARASRGGKGPARVSGRAIGPQHP